MPWARVRRPPTGATAVLRGGGQIPFDAAIVATGVLPNGVLAVTAGLRLGASGAIAVDDHLCTSDPLIYAAGDNSESRLCPTGGAVNVTLVRPTNGRVAGANAALDLLDVPR